MARLTYLGSFGVWFGLEARDFKRLERKERKSKALVQQVVTCCSGSGRGRACCIMHGDHDRQAGMTFSNLSARSGRGLGFRSASLKKAENLSTNR